MKKIKNIERHKNGRLAYFEQFMQVTPVKTDLYYNVIKDNAGNMWVRIGWHKKYFENGQLAWQLKYDKQGKLIPGKNKAFRSDGTPIKF